MSLVPFGGPCLAQSPATTTTDRRHTPPLHHHHHHHSEPPQHHPPHIPHSLGWRAQEPVRDLGLLAHKPNPHIVGATQGPPLFFRHPWTIGVNPPAAVGPASPPALIPITTLAAISPPSTGSSAYGTYLPPIPPPHIPTNWPPLGSAS